MDVELLIGIFPQVLLDGIILGFMYALIALGYTMVYGVLEFINFAHSEIFIVGAFVGVEVMLGLKSVGLLEGLPWPVVLILVLLAGITGDIAFDSKGDRQKAQYFVLQVASDDPQKWGDNKIVKQLTIAAPEAKK